MSNLVSFAYTELGNNYLNDDDNELEKIICNNVIELLEVFSKQGHSSSSANHILNLFQKLAKRKILSLLLGVDSEFNEYGQNIRDSRVFKNNDKYYQLDYYIFREKTGHIYTDLYSCKTIRKFPYTPKSIFVDEDSNLFKILHRKEANIDY